MFPINPFENDPSSGGRSPEDFVRDTQNFVHSELHSRDSIDVSSLSFEEQVRHFLIKNRAEELFQRFSTPQFRERTQALMEGAFQNLAHVDGTEENSDGSLNFSESLGIEYKETSQGEEVPEELKMMAEGLLSMPEMLQFRAYKAAENEYLPSSTRVMVSSNLRLLLAAPPGALQGISSQEIEMAKFTLGIFEFQGKVFEATLAVARKEGVLTATEPKRVKDIIRSLVSRENFVEMRLKGISGLSDSIDTVAKAIAHFAPDSDQALRVITGALKSGGQLERIEIEALCHLMADVKLIWGE